MVQAKTSSGAGKKLFLVQAGADKKEETQLSAVALREICANPPTPNPPTHTPTTPTTPPTPSAGGGWGSPRSLAEGGQLFVRKNPVSTGWTILSEEKSGKRKVVAAKPGKDENLTSNKQWLTQLKRDNCCLKAFGCWFSLDKLQTKDDDHCDGEE